MKAIHRAEVADLRASMRRLGMAVAEIDGGLRYLWIDPPAPADGPHAVIGRRDDELLPATVAGPIIALKQDAFALGERVTRVLTFVGRHEVRRWSVSACPVLDGGGRFTTILTVGFDPRALMS